MHVDEAAQLGRMPALTSAITLGRGFGIRAALLVQSLSQLSGAYGRDYQAIAENCSLLTMGGRTGFAMAEHLSTSGFGDVTPECIYGLSETETMIRASERVFISKYSAIVMTSLKPSAPSSPLIHNLLTRL